MSDIAELMRRDPLKLTRDDVLEIVKYFRANKQQFNLGNMKAGSTKPKTAKEKQVSALALSLDLKLDI